VSVAAGLQPVFIVAAAVVGITVGRRIDGFVLYAPYVIKWSLMILLLFVFLNTRVREIARAFRNVRFSVSSLLINFMWTPVFAFVLTVLFFGGQVDVRLGFIMLMVTPCTDWYLVFTGLSGGNVALGSSVLPLNLILQIVLLPVYVLVFMGNAVAFNASIILNSVVFVLIVPLAAANVIRAVNVKLPVKRAVEQFIAAASDTVQFIFLCLAVAAMFASQGDLLLENPRMFGTVFPPLIIFFIINFCIAFFVGKRLKLSFEDRVPLIFTTAARNSPIALAIASVAFPDRPVVSLVLVVGPLIELPVLALISAILRRIDPARLRRPVKAG
jgi:ACR3 family arsenite efflux pump ArsB